MKRYSKGNSFKKTVVQTFGSSTLMSIFSFFSAVVIARALEAEERGVLASYQLIVVLVAGLSQLGLAQAFVYVFRKDRDFAAAEGIKFSLGLIGSLCIILYFIGGAIFTRSEFNNEIVFWGCLIFASYSFFLGVLQVFSGLIEFNLISLLYSFSYLLFVFAAFFFEGGSADLFFVGQVVIYSFLIVPMMYWCYLAFKGEAGERSCKGVVQLFKNGFGFYGVSVIGLVIGNIDKVVINFHGAMTVMGLYVVAYTASRLITLFQNSLATVIYARYAGNAGLGAANAVATSFRITFVPLLIFAAGASFFSERLIVFVFGQGYREASGIFSVLIFEAVVGGGSWVLAQYFNAVGRSGVVLWRQLVSIAPVIILVPFLPEQYLGIGLASALLISSIVRLLITMGIFRYLFGLPVPSLLPTNADIALVGSSIKKYMR